MQNVKPSKPDEDFNEIMRVLSRSSSNLVQEEGVLEGYMNSI